LNQWIHGSFLSFPAQLILVNRGPEQAKNPAGEKFFRLICFIGNSAGNGNRTRIASLEGWNFTIKLCPRLSSENSDRWRLISQRRLNRAAARPAVGRYRYFSNAVATKVAL
jgi:hypothetical protein